MKDMENKVEAKGEDTLKRSRSKGPSKSWKGNKNMKGDGSSTGGESEHGIHIWTERERRKKMKNMFNGLHALLPQLPAKADKSTIVDEAIKYISTLQETLKSLEKQKAEKKLQAHQGQGKHLLGHQSTVVLDYSPYSTTPPEAIIGSSSHTPARPQDFPPDQQQQQQQKQLPLIMNHGIGGVLGLLNNNTNNNNNVVVNAPSSSSFGVPAFPVCFQTWFSPNVVLSMCGDDAQISVCSPRKPGLLATVLYILDKHNLDVVSAHVSADQFRCIYLIHARATGGNNSDNLLETLAVEDTFKLAAGEMNLWLSSC